MAAVCYAPLALALAAGCAAAPRAAVVAAAASGCGGQQIAWTEADAGRVAGLLGVEATLGVRRSELAGAAGRLSEGGLVYFGGHGTVVEDGAGWRSLLCAADDPVGVDELLRSLDPVPWATLVISACESAFVDVRHAKAAVSVVSASEGLVARLPPAGRDEARPRSPYAPPAGFSDALVESLGAGADANGDCLVTDREMASELERRLSSVSGGVAAEHRAYLRVRRNVDGDVPVRRLPASPRCRATWSRLEALAAAVPDPELAARLREQLRLARGEASKVPESPVDYILCDRPIEGLPRRGLERFSGTRAAALELAQLASFADVYEVQQSLRWVRVVRLRDGALMATRPILDAGPDAAIREALPSRGRILETLGSTDLVVRFAGRAPRGQLTAGATDLAIDDAPAVPCPTMEGQCFLVSHDSGAAFRPGAPVEWEAAPGPPEEP